MPVWKFHSVEEMPPTPSYEPESARHIEHWRALWERSTRIAGKRFRPGVYRYRSVEESQRAFIEVAPATGSEARSAPNGEGE